MIEKTAPPAPLDNIVILEGEIGASLPDDYRRFLIGSNGGYLGGALWYTGPTPNGEAADAGVSMYYVGVGPTRVDPLPEVFGPRRSQRIRRIEELPRVLAHVHRELVAA